MQKLWLTQNDISEKTAFSGNIDADSLIPFVQMAQKNDLKRILGLNLYNKIDDDIQNDTPLTGDYLTIFNEYAVDLLVYYSCTNYMGFGGYKTANAGIFKQIGDNVTPVDFKEVDVLIGRYRQLAVNVETAFYDYIKTINIPEWNLTTETSSNAIIPWY